MAPKLDNSELDFTPEKQKVYEEYLRTGKVDGEEINNMFAVARKIGTSISRINKWQLEQNQRFLQEKEHALHELDLLQRRTQNQLITQIVKTTLWIIGGVGTVTTGLYIFAMTMQYDIKIIESTWSNMFGILLTNSFSILGTIMGVKYSENK